MPLIRAETRIGDNAQYVLNAGEDFFVANGLTIRSNNALPIFCTSPGAHLLRIEGRIEGYQGALLCGVQNVDGPAYVYIGKTGVLASQQSVVGGYGIGLQARSSVLENHGVISAYNGISLNARGSSTVSTEALVINSGTINAVGAAIYSPASMSASEVTRVINTGQMLGAQYAVYFDGAGGYVSFVNSGTAQGDIAFGLNGGKYDGSLGILLAAPGAVGPARISTTGGRMDLAPGRSAERFDLTNASSGSISFENSPTGVQFSLDDSLAQKGAFIEGDLYLGLNKVTALIGARIGGDWLRGGGNDEFLLGLGGNDRLEGQAGNDYIFGDGDRDTLSGGEGIDRLYGGRGRDVVSGGVGRDYFTFYKAGEFGDQFTDFTAAEDEIAIFAVTLGYAAAPSDRFVTADEFRQTFGHHRAGDRSDRFIYDAKKTELWFDPDGTGRKKAFLLADLQPAAALTANDVHLYFSD